MEENNIETTVDSTAIEPTDATVNGVEEEVVQAVEGQNESDVDNASAEDIVDNTENKIDDGEKFAKAFSKRLNKEKEKLSKEFEPFKKVVSLAAKQFNMSEEEYIKSILEDYGDDEDLTPKEKDEKDLLIEELLNEKREKEVAREWERQIKALQDIDKDITIDKITDDMLILADEKKIPLEYIYAHEMLTNGRKDFEKAIEDKIMAKINKVNSSSAGSMTSSKVESKAPSINTMSSKDFEALKERVKRGEKVNL